MGLVRNPESSEVAFKIWFAWWCKEQNLSIDQLHWLKSDAQHRIETYEASGDLIAVGYIEKQKQIVELAQEELNKRRCVD